MSRAIPSLRAARPDSITYTPQLNIDRVFFKINKIKIFNGSILS